MKFVGIVDTKFLKPKLSASLAASVATVAVLAVATSLLACRADAQTYTPPAPAAKTAPAPKAAKAPAKPKTDDAATSTAAATSDAPKSGGEAQLRQRVDQLEEQLVDLQVTIGTLESLARNPGSSSASSATASRSSGSSSGGADNGRVDILETQIRALTAQVEQLSDQVRAANSGRRTQAAPSDAPLAEARPTRPSSTPSFGSTAVTPSRPGTGDAAQDSDQIGGLINGGQTPRAAASAPGGPPPTSDAGAKQLYETAYGFLLQTNYGAAEAAFDDFLSRYPNDALSGNAQYWLGESFFVRGQFKQAASAFLKGYQSYGKSAKAPDSLLKLALSLDRLGQRDAACSSFGELTTKYPSASAPVKTRAENERRRIGC
jgi:tol-pal system protein YbgF